MAQRTEKSRLVSAMSGSLSGACVSAIVQPLDVVLQVGHEAAQLADDGVGVELVEHAAGQRRGARVQLMSLTVG